eukprot:Rmarinus@m.8043
MIRPLEVWSWGSGRFGCTGSYDGQPDENPTRLALPFELMSVQKLVCGSYHNAIMTNEGELCVWGRGDHGQLANGSETSTCAPAYIEMTRVRDGDAGGGKRIGAKDVICSDNATIFVDDAGRVRLWGGYMRRSVDPAPVPIPEGIRVTKVTCGRNHTLALTAAGDLFSWGSGSNGQLGHGGQELARVPSRIEFFARHGVNLVDMAAGDDFSIAIAEGGGAFGFGDGTDGQLGTGNTMSRLVPMPILRPGGVRFSKVVCGSKHTLVVAEDGLLWGWGDNHYGQLGSMPDGQLGNGVLVPTLLPKLRKKIFRQIVAGGIMSAGITDQHDLLVWGQFKSINVPACGKTNKQARADRLMRKRERREKMKSRDSARSQRTYPSITSSDMDDDLYNSSNSSSSSGEDGVTNRNGILLPTIWSVAPSSVSFKTPRRTSLLPQGPRKSSLFNGVSPFNMKTGAHGSTFGRQALSTPSVERGGVRSAIVSRGSSRMYSIADGAIAGPDPANACEPTKVFVGTRRRVLHVACGVDHVAVVVQILGKYHPDYILYSEESDSSGADSIATPESMSPYSSPGSPTDVGPFGPLQPVEEDDEVQSSPRMRIRPAVLHISPSQSPSSSSGESPQSTRSKYSSDSPCHGVSQSPHVRGNECLPNETHQRMRERECTVTSTQSMPSMECFEENMASRSHTAPEHVNRCTSTVSRTRSALQARVVGKRTTAHKRAFAPLRGGRLTGVEDAPSASPPDSNISPTLRSRDMRNSQSPVAPSRSPSAFAPLSILEASRSAMDLAHRRSTGDVSRQGEKRKSKHALKRYSESGLASARLVENMECSLDATQSSPPSPRSPKPLGSEGPHHDDPVSPVVPLTGRSTRTARRFRSLSGSPSSGHPTSHSPRRPHTPPHGESRSQSHSPSRGPRLPRSPSHSLTPAHTHSPPSPHSPSHHHPSPTPSLSRSPRTLMETSGHTSKLHQSPRASVAVSPRSHRDDSFESDSVPLILRQKTMAVYPNEDTSETSHVPSPTASPASAAAPISPSATQGNTYTTDTAATLLPGGPPGDLATIDEAQVAPEGLAEQFSPDQRAAPQDSRVHPGPTAIDPGRKSLLSSSSSQPPPEVSAFSSGSTSDNSGGSGVVGVSAGATDKGSRSPLKPSGGTSGRLANPNTLRVHDDGCSGEGSASSSEAEQAKCPRSRKQSKQYDTLSPRATPGKPKAVPATLRLREDTSNYGLSGSETEQEGGPGGLSPRSRLGKSVPVFDDDSDGGSAGDSGGGSGSAGEAGPGRKLGKSNRGKLGASASMMHMRPKAKVPRKHRKTAVVIPAIQTDVIDDAPPALGPPTPTTPNCGNQEKRRMTLLDLRLGLADQQQQASSTRNRTLLRSTSKRYSQVHAGGSSKVLTGGESSTSITIIAAAKAAAAVRKLRGLSSRRLEGPTSDESPTSSSAVTPASPASLQTMQSSAALREVMEIRALSLARAKPSPRAFPSVETGENHTGEESEVMDEKADLTDSSFESHSAVMSNQGSYGDNDNCNNFNNNDNYDNYEGSVRSVAFSDPAPRVSAGGDGGGGLAAVCENAATTESTSTPVASDKDSTAAPSVTDAATTATAVASEDRCVPLLLRTSVKNDVLETSEGHVASPHPPLDASRSPFSTEHKLSCTPPTHTDRSQGSSRPPSNVKRPTAVRRFSSVDLPRKGSIESPMCAPHHPHSPARISGAPPRQRSRKLRKAASLDSSLDPEAMDKMRGKTREDNPLLSGYRDEVPSALSTPVPPPPVPLSPHAVKVTAATTPTFTSTAATTSAPDPNDGDSAVIDANELPGGRVGGDVGSGGSGGGSGTPRESNVTKSRMQRKPSRIGDETTRGATTVQRAIEVHVPPPTSRTGLDEISEEEKAKIQERAKRRKLSRDVADAVMLKHNEDASTPSQRRNSLGVRRNSLGQSVNRRMSRPSAMETVLVNTPSSARYSLDGRRSSLVADDPHNSFQSSPHAHTARAGLSSARAVNTDAAMNDAGTTNDMSVRKKPATAPGIMMRANDNHMPRAFESDLEEGASLLELLQFKGTTDSLTKLMDDAAKFDYVSECARLYTPPSGRLLRQFCQPKMTLCHRGLGARGTTASSALLFACAGLKKLVLKGNNIDDEGLLALADSLTQGDPGETLEHIDLSYNSLSHQANEGLNLLATLPRLEVLLLQHNKLRSSSMVELQRVFAYVEESGYEVPLRVLDVSYNNIGKEGGEAIGRMLKRGNPPNIQYLSIAWNCLTPKGVKAVMLGVAENKTIREVDASWNRLDSDAGMAVAEAIAMNSTMHTLKLTHCDVTQEGAVVISDGVVRNRVLKVLDLASNPMGEDGKRVLLQAYQSNPVLEKLCMDHIGTALKSKDAPTFDAGNVMNAHYRLNLEKPWDRWVAKRLHLRTLSEGGEHWRNCTLNNRVYSTAPKVLPESGILEFDHICDVPRKPLFKVRMALNLGNLGSREVAQKVEQRALSSSFEDWHHEKISGKPFCFRNNVQKELPHRGVLELDYVVYKLPKLNDGGFNQLDLSIPSDRKVADLVIKRTLKRKCKVANVRFNKQPLDVLARYKHGYRGPPKSGIMEFFYYCEVLKGVATVHDSSDESEENTNKSKISAERLKRIMTLYDDSSR